MKASECVGFEGVGKFADRPPCLKLKHFLEEGDPLYYCDYYYCFECKRIWCYSDMNYVKDEQYWECIPLERLQNPNHWHGWIDAPAEPKDAFLHGIAGLEQWLVTLQAPLDFRRPI